MAKGVFIALLILLTSNILRGQNLLSRHYTMANGLPSNEVYTILKASSGYIWIGTDRGMCKFDGQTFKLFTTKEGLAENSTLEIKEDKLGRIWCRSYSGLFTIVDNDIATAIALNSEINKQEVGTNLYQFELDDSMNLFIGTRMSGNIYKSCIPYNTLQQLAMPSSIIKYLQINNSKSLISYSMQYFIQNKNCNAAIILKTNSYNFPLQVSKPSINVFLRYLNLKNNYIFSTDNAIHTYNTSTNNTNRLLLPFRVSAMEAITDSTYLVGGFKGELAVINLYTNNFIMIDKFSSSISKIIYQKNACWITTLKNGIYYVPNIHYAVVHTNTEPLISMLPISKDSLLVLNANSEADMISKTKTQKLDNLSTQKTLMYWQHFDQSQNKYIAPIGCFNYMINRATHKKVFYDLKEKHSWSNTEFVVPIDSIIYASFYGSVRMYYNAKQYTEITLPNKNRITFMFGNKGKLYLGTLQGVFSLQENKLVPLDTMLFLQNKIMAIDKLDEHTLIIATQSNGLATYNLQTKKLTENSNKFGLDKLAIEHISVDTEKKIWIATKTSIHVLKNLSTASPILLDVLDLQLEDLSIREVKCLDNKVYILAGNRVVTIPESRIQFNSHPFLFVVNDILVNGKSCSVNHIDAIHLKPTENNLLLKYQLLTYIQNSPSEYRYRLNDEPWTFTSNNQLQLVSLSGGSYVLKIQGRLKNGLWSDVHQINFTIKTIFYKTLGFILLSILASLSIIYFLLSYYFKNKLKNRLKEFELKRELESARLMASKSQMNPHFIFNALNSIQNFIIKSDKMQAYQYLNDFSSLIRNYLQYSNKDYVKLEKELELIHTYIKIEQLRIPFVVDIQIDSSIKANEEFVFTLLLQPIVENAIWHGLNHQLGDKKLSIFFKKQNNKIEINVTDNGIGRAQSKMINAERISKPASVATDNMNSRIASLKLLHKNEINVKILDNFDHQNKACGTTVLISFDSIHEKN